MGKWMQNIEKWLGSGGGGEGGSKRSRTLMWLILIGLLGAALMIMNSFLTVKQVDPYTEGPRASPADETAAVLGRTASKEQSMFREYEETYEQKLREILQKIIGVNDPEVMVSIESTEEVIVEKNNNDSQSLTNERDTNGAQRSISELTRRGETVLVQSSGNQQPIVLKYIKPKVRGVIVVAKGAENAAIKKMIIEAVERGIGVGAHRISVLPRKQ